MLRVELFYFEYIFRYIIYVLKEIIESNFCIENNCLLKLSI